MDIKLLHKSLNESERKHLFEILSEEFAPKADKKQFTSVEEFIAQNHGKMSKRLKNVLSANLYYSNGDGHDSNGNLIKKHLPYIEVFDPDLLDKLRNAGPTVKHEFIKLRGY